MAQPAQCRHDTRRDTPFDWRTAPRDDAIITGRFGKAHRNPAPTEAASPTRNVVHVSWVAKAVAKIGARVETDPSISPPTQVAPKSG